LPENWIEDKRPLFAFNEVGLTADDRVMAMTIGGTNRNIPARRWVVGPDQARLVLEHGSDVKRDGVAVGQINTMKVVAADNSGRVLLLTTLTNASGLPYPSEPALVLWAEKQGAQLVAFHGEELPGLDGGGQLGSIEHTTFSLGKNGDLAFYCPAVRSPAAHTVIPMVLVWAGGALKIAAYEPSGPPSSFYGDTIVVGGQVHKVDANKVTLDLTKYLWLPDGTVGIFCQEKKLIKGELMTSGRVWTYDPATGNITDFEAGDSLDRTFFGPDQMVAIMAARYGIDDSEPKIVPTKIRVGPRNSAIDLFDYAHGKIPGMESGQSFASTDASHRTSLVALGPGHQIAFTAFLESNSGSPGSQPAMVQPFRPNGPHASGQWVLIVGKIGEPNSLRIVAEESMLSAAGSYRDLPAGSFETLAYSEDGTLIFTTSGFPSHPARAMRTRMTASPHFCWAFDSAGLKLLASSSDRISPDGKNQSGFGGFTPQIAGAGRIVLARQLNDAVAIVSNSK
jgi:hypothetical protein